MPASPFVGKVLLIPAQQSGHGVVYDELQENVFWLSACMREKMVSSQIAPCSDLSVEVLLHTSPHLVAANLLRIPLLICLCSSSLAW